MPALDQLIIDLTSGDDERAESAVTAFPGHGDQAIAPLTKLLQTDNSDHRWWAVRTLSGFRQKSLIPLLLSALKDKDRSVQHCTAMAMRNIQDPSFIPALIAELSSPDRMLARLSADALISIGKNSTSQLLEVLAHGSQVARMESVRALALIGDYAAVSDLFNLLDSDSAITQYWANQGLQNMGIGMSFFDPS